MDRKYNNITYDELALELQRAFQSALGLYEIEDKITQRTQRSTESSEKFIYELESLLNERDVNMPQEERVRRIIRNCRSVFRKDLQVQKPKTVKECLDTMRRIESSLQLNQR